VRGEKSVAIPRLREAVRPINIQLTCRSKIRKWAFENAYTLIFLSIFYVITWVLIVVANYA
jgi:hypothetical protein